MVRQSESQKRTLVQSIHERKNMKAELEIARSEETGVCPAPSLRVPVTADNRALLRWLRAAELSAWETGEAEAFAAVREAAAHPAVLGAPSVDSI